MLGFLCFFEGGDKCVKQREGKIHSQITAFCGFGFWYFSANEMKQLKFRGTECLHLQFFVFCC